MALSTAANGDWRRYRAFLKDSNRVRWGTRVQKVNYFTRYNQEVVPRFSTLEANFQIWAHCLSAVHPPDHQLVDLNVAGGNQRDYSTQYRFNGTCIKVPAAGCVWHYLLPENNPRGRAILLFRGTAPHPATYRSRRGSLHTEPIGAYADGNIIGVSRLSFERIRPHIAQWLATQSQERRHVTFVGFSLGGALAMRSLLHYATRTPGAFEWEQSELYIFNSPGLENSAAAELTLRFPPAQLRAIWHVDDYVSKTGYYPRTMGTEYSRSHRVSLFDPAQTAATYPRLTHLSVIKRHNLPLLAIEEVWHETIAYAAESVDGAPIVSRHARAITDNIRQSLYGVIGASAIWVVMGGYTLGKTAFSQLRLMPEDFCQHDRH